MSKNGLDDEPNFNLDSHLKKWRFQGGVMKMRLVFNVVWKVLDEMLPTNRFSKLNLLQQVHKSLILIFELGQTE